MIFSLVAEFSGLPDVHAMSDIDYGDIKRALKSARIPFDESGPGDTEWLYLAKEQWPGVNWEFDCPHTRHCKCRERAADRESRRLDIDPDSFWFKWGFWARSITVGTILDRKTFDTFRDDLGLYAEDVQTLGTLGGPLSGGMPYVVPDIVFRLDSQVILESIRVTPVPTRKGQPLRGKENTFDRLRGAVLSVYGC